MFHQHQRGPQRQRQLDGLMKDLAEIARQSQVDAMASITKRATEHIQKIEKIMQPPGRP